MPVAFRALILGAMLALGALGARAGDAHASTVGRAPVGDDVFAAPGWTVGPPTVLKQNEVTFVSRRYTATSGDASAVLSVAVSSQAKKVYRAGPEIPFEGTGYAIAVAPAGLITPKTSWSTLIARRGNDALLLVTAHGERRGLLGNGALAWVAATFDGVVGARNEYFQATFVAPLSGHDNPLVAHEVQALAGRVFQQLARWDANQLTE